LRTQVTLDRILDMAVPVVTAKIGAGRQHTLPAKPVHDAAGLPMETL